MQNSRLFDLLRLLSEDEWKGARKYLRGHLGDGNESFKLFEFIYKYKANLDSKKLSLDLMLSSVFKGVSRKNLLNQMSRLTKEIEDNLAYQEVGREERLLMLYKFKAMNRLGNYERADSIYKRLAPMLSEKNELDLWDSYLSLDLYHSYYFSYNPVKSSIHGRGLLEKAIAAAGDVHLAFNLFQRVAVINRGLMYGESWEGILKEIDQLSQETNNPPLIACLRMINNALEDPTWHNYELLKEYTNDRNISIHQDIRTFIFIVLNKLLAIKVAEADARSRIEQASYLHEAIMQGHLLHNNLIPLETFLVAVGANVYLKKYEKAEELVTYAKDKLSVESKSEYLTLAQMRIYRGKGQYQELLTLYNKNKVNTVRFNNHAYPILLQSSYEEGSATFDFITYEIRNYKAYLKRNKSQMNERIFEGTWNFLNILSLMIKGKGELKILEQMAAFDNLFYRTWLEEQLQLYGQKK